MNPLPPDPYKILGVSKDAQIPEIRSAHRKLVLKCHPDKVQDPTLKAAKQDEFQRVQQAYELLTNETERERYDDQIKIRELRKEVQKNMAANTSATRTPPRHYEVRTAEPRPSTFASSPVPPQPKMYSAKHPTRSWGENIHNTSRIFEEVGRTARRTASYEKPSKRDEEREREREREPRRRKKEEEEEEARRAERLNQRDKERREKKRQEKEREKALKRESEEKRNRHKPPYVEPYEDAEIPYVAKVEKKKPSTSKKHDETRERSSHRDEPPANTERKVDANIEYAISYLMQSQKKGASASRNVESVFPRYSSPTRQPAVPTPPPAGPSSFHPPEEDDTRRSSAKAAGRRGSHDSSRTVKERNSHRKTSSGPKDMPGSPIIRDASPSGRPLPSFSKSATTPPIVSSSPPRRDLHRAHTMNEAQSSRPAPQPAPKPGIRRSETYHLGDDNRGRSRSRSYPQVEIEEVSEDERPREKEHRKHRERRHKTRSPEPVPTEYVPRSPTMSARYVINHNGRTVPLHFRDDSPPRKHSSRHHPFQPTHPRIVDVRPNMSPRESSWGSNGGLKVKTAKAYGDSDINYSSVPHYTRRDDSVWA